MLLKILNFLIDIIHLRIDHQARAVIFSHFRLYAYFLAKKVKIKIE